MSDLRRLLLLLICVLPTVALASQPPTLPDHKLTPGDTLPVSMDQVCVPGYAHSARHVSNTTKHHVYLEYGLPHHKPGEFEVDHLISLELGGSNDIKNLWPESYHTRPWNAHVKDKLENRLHELVCTGKISLKEAQQTISKDWISAYKKYVSSESPTE